MTDEQKPVLEAAVETIARTMEAGAVQRVGMSADDASFWNKENTHHMKKALWHLLAAYHHQDVNYREVSEPHLIHIDCCLTRLAMIKAKLKKEKTDAIAALIEAE